MEKLSEIFALEKDDFKLFLWENNEELKMLYNQLPHSYRIIAEKKFKALSRQKEWIATRIILKEKLGNNADIAYEPNCKPIIVGTTNKINISISHSKNFVCISLSTKYSIGVDIEKISPRILKVQKYLHKDLFTEEQSTEEQLKKMTVIWSTKEAVFKAYSNEIGTMFEVITENFTLKDKGEIKTYLAKDKSYKICAYYKLINNLAVVYCINKKK